MKHALLAVIGAVMVAAGSAAAQEGMSEPAAKIKNQLSTMRISLDFNQARLRDVIAYLQEFSGLNFHVDGDIDAKEDDERVTIKVKDVTLKSALKLVLNPRDLKCIYRDGVLRILPKSKLSDRMITRVYDARDLAFGIQDFPGPKMEMASPGGQPMPGVLFDLQEEPRVALPSDMLVELIKSNSGAGTWEETASIEPLNGLLVISQEAAVHAEIAELLNRLRQYK